MKINLFLLATILGLALFTTASFAADAPAKLPVPASVSQAAATKLVEDLYQKDISAAKTPEQKSTLAKKLIAAGVEEPTDMAGKFALFTIARDTAAVAGDLPTAFSAIEQLDAAFRIDPLKMKIDAASMVAKALHTPQVSSPFLSQMSILTAEAMSAERFELAQSAADLALDKAKGSGDSGLLRDALAQVQQVRAANSAYHEAQLAAAVLQTKPNDPQANQKVGMYRCLIKGDWQAGLPMLAQSGDLELKALAEKELKGATDTIAQLALGDEWWDISQKNSGMTKLRMQRRAARWYQELQPKLHGLEKIKVESRLATLSAADLHTDEALKVVNLLELVDIEKDLVRGKWVMKDGALVADLLDVCSLGFPYKPPEEYDYKVSFTRIEGHGSAEIICAGFGHQFQFTIGDGYDNNSICGFFLIDGKPPANNSTGHHIPGLPKLGQRCTCIVKVRKDGVKAYLDGKLVSEYKTDFHNFSIGVGWDLKQGDVVGLGEWGPRTAFDSVQIVEVTGKGERLRDK